MKLILSFLLHHANRCVKSSEFYAIKDIILNRYGETIGYDMQFIEGKECFKCEGSGQYYYLDNYRIWNSEPCWHCDNGWYKKPMWVLLAIKRFGKYKFHKPVDRKYQEKNPYEKLYGFIPQKLITGYIDHDESRYSYLAVYCLYLIYNRPLLRKHFMESVGIYWYTQWYWPRNWFHSLVYLIRNGKKSRPFVDIKQKIERWWNTEVEYDPEQEELPF